MHANACAHALVRATSGHASTNARPRTPTAAIATATLRDRFGSSDRISSRNPRSADEPCATTTPNVSIDERTDGSKSNATDMGTTSATHNERSSLAPQALASTTDGSTKRIESQRTIGCSEGSNRRSAWPTAQTAQTAPQRERACHLRHTMPTAKKRARQAQNGAGRGMPDRMRQFGFGTGGFGCGGWTGLGSGFGSGGRGGSGGNDPGSLCMMRTSFLATSCHERIADAR